MIAIVRRFRRLLGPEHASLMDRYLLASVVAAFATGIAVTAGIGALARLLDGDRDDAARWAAACALLALAAGGLTYLATLRGFAVSLRLLSALRPHIAEQLTTLPLGWFTPANTGRATSVLNRGTIEILGIPNHQLNPLVRAVVVPATVLAALVVLDPLVAASAAVCMPLAALVMRFAQRHGVRHDHAVRLADDEMSGRIVEYAQAQETLRAHTAGSVGRRPLDDAFARLRAAERAQLRSVVPAIALSHCVAQLAFLAVLAVAAALSTAQGADQGQAAAAIAAVVGCHIALQSLADVGVHGSAIRMAMARLDDIDAILEEAPLPVVAGETADGPVLRVRDVAVSYDGARVLDGLSLELASGTLTALVGSSGSGKSTLARLLARFADPDAGTVELGGRDVRTLRPDELGARVAHVFQDTFVFAGTLEENIAIARPGMTARELADVVRQAGLEELVRHLPEGLATRVGDGGRRLSGGESQRVAIARALASRAPLLVLDEPTSALDAETEAQLLRTLLRLRRDRTILLITHRLAPIMAADRIVVLHDGAAREQGTHAELLARDGRYATFWNARRAAEGWRV